MILTEELKTFIATHLNDNTDKLLLSASCFLGVDVSFAVNQILIRRQLKEKLPEWATHPDLIFPSRISAEQCSSSLTAQYKQRLLRGNSLCDMTGGMGVDASFFAQKAGKVIYVEQQEAYCQAATHNFHTMHIDNIQVIHADATKIIEQLHADTFYVDPARRSQTNKRLFALSDCEPDVVELKVRLLKKAMRVILKISPMADITESLTLLPETTEIHILAVKNECKELLFVLENNPEKETIIHTVNFISGNRAQYLSFRPEEEKAVALSLAEHIEKYLYEPNASILKSGAFKWVAHFFDIEKLHISSHLYTSDKYIADFPGRSFLVKEIVAFSGKNLEALGKTYPQAHITTRNFPLSVENIRKRGKIKEGGDTYLFATTTKNGKAMIVCDKQ